MAEIESKLTATQQRALEALLSGKAIPCVAKELGIGERTLYRWCSENAEFKSAWEEMLAELWNATKAKLKSMGGTALQVLIDIMQSIGATNKEKLEASKTVLANLHKVVTDDELRKRVEELIVRMEAQGGVTPAN